MMKLTFAPSVINRRPTTWLALCLRCGAILFLYMCTAIVVYEKKITLTQGRFVKVGYWWHAWLSQWTWYAYKNKTNYYAARSVRLANNTFRPLRLHNVILKPAAHKIIDHADRNGLNCLPHNLRQATHSENGKNRTPRKNTTSNFLGVSYYKSRGKWLAQITHEGRNKSLGYFDTEIEAAKAYDAAAIIYHKEFANINFGIAPQSKHDYDADRKNQLRQDIFDLNRKLKDIKNQFATINI